MPMASPTKTHTEIRITESKLKEVNSIQEGTAKEIISSSKKAMVNGNPADMKSAPDSITIEVAADLNQPCLILLTGERDEIVALLGYDPIKKKFLPEEDQIS
jgi:hypothetical protein